MCVHKRVFTRWSQHRASLGVSMFKPGFGTLPVLALKPQPFVPVSLSVTPTPNSGNVAFCVQWAATPSNTACLFPSLPARPEQARSFSSRRPLASEVSPWMAWTLLLGFLSPGTHRFRGLLETAPPLQGGNNNALIRLGHLSLGGQWKILQSSCQEMT